jgi:hypothetical protein
MPELNLGVWRVAGTDDALYQANAFADACLAEFRAAVKS